MIVNFNYSTDYQCQYYVLRSLVMNLKFPLVRNRAAIQRNSFNSLSTLNRPPPGFESIGSNKLKYPVSQFANKTKVKISSDRFSPNFEDVKQSLVRK